MGMIWLREMCEEGSATPPSSLENVFTNWQFKEFEESVRSNPKKLSELKSAIGDEEYLHNAVLAAELAGVFGDSDESPSGGLPEWELSEGESKFKLRIVTWPTSSDVDDSTENDIILVTGIPPSQLEGWLAKRKGKGLVVSMIGRSLYVCSPPDGGGQAGASGLVLLRNQVYSRLRDSLVARGYVTLEKSSLSLLRSQQSLSSILQLLLSSGFSLTVFRESILATHSSGKMIFVRISSAVDDLSKLPDIRGLIVDPSEFEKVLDRLLKFWNQVYEIDSSKFNQDVLTDLGWHSYSSVLERQSALDTAVALYGVDHVVRLLTWLSNSWRHHPTNYVHVDAVDEDLGWVYKSYESSGQYRLRYEALEALRAECQGLIETNLEFRQKISSPHEVDRYFVVRI
jgi:hypothetical protein